MAVRSLITGFEAEKWKKTYYYVLFFISWLYDAGSIFLLLNATGF